MYATGNAATIPNLMDALSAFAQANAGMTESVRRTENNIVAWDGSTSNASTVICLSKGASNWWFAYNAIDCLGFASDTNSMGAWPVSNAPSSGYPSFVPTGPACYPARLMPLLPPFISYDFFTEGSVVHMAAQQTTGAFAHLNFGDITKYGSWTGGAYVSVTCAQQAISQGQQNAGFGGQNHLFGAINNQATPPEQYTRMRITQDVRREGIFLGNSDGLTYCVLTGLAGNNGMRMLARDQPNVFNNRSTGPRMELFCKDDGPGGTNLNLPLGYIPNIRSINVQLLNPRDTINTDWMAFPMQSKLPAPGGITWGYTGNYGWAVRK